MNKNWIGGLRCRASGQMIAKPTSIKGTGGKSSGCAWKAIELSSGKLLTGLQASQSEQRKSGDRRHESRRALGLPEAALALYTGAAVAWDLPTTTGETGGNPEAGRRGAKAWHPNGAGSIDPAGGDAGSTTQMGPE